MELVTKRKHEGREENERVAYVRLPTKAPSNLDLQRISKLRPYKVIKGIHDMDVDEILSLQTVYNRPVRDVRLKKLIDSMEEDGFHESQVIELNENLQIIDGQGRVLAAKAVGIKEVPVVIYEFNDIEREAKFCKRRNNTQTNQTSKERWLCDSVGGYPLAQVLYRLNADEDSKAYKRIDLLKGPKDSWRIDTQYKITASPVVHIINIVANNKNSAYKDTDAEKLDAAVATMPYVNLRKGVNMVLGMFYDIFGSRANNKIAYSDRFFRSYLSFAKILLDHNLLEKNYDKIVYKMRGFEVREYLKELEQDEVVKRLKRFYNSGKKHDRI